MSHLVRRFVCGRCGATAPLSGRPFQQCASCKAVSDYDFGVARAHPAWPAHEARFGELFAANSDALASASADNDLAAYATTYATILRPLVGQFTELYPERARERGYRAQLVGFYASWQAVTAIDPGVRDADTLFRYLRGKATPSNPASLWAFVDQAIAANAAIQRALDAAPPGPPDDFVAGFATRFSVSICVAEWLPQLSAPAQRELVTRFGVSREYVAPVDDEVTCPNCGGTIAVAPGFLAMPCPYCAAEIQEARAGYRAVEANRWARSEYERGLADAVAGTSLARVEVLDGPVARKGKPYRMVVMRAHTARELADFWFMFDVPDSTKLAAALAWADSLAARGTQVVRTPYREHPRFAEVPHSAAELFSRAAGPTPALYPVSFGAGVSIEQLDGGTVVRLVHDRDGEHAGALRAWIGYGAATP